MNDQNYCSWDDDYEEAPSKPTPNQLREQRESDERVAWLEGKERLEVLAIIHKHGERRWQDERHKLSPEDREWLRDWKRKRKRAFSAPVNRSGINTRLKEGREARRAA